MDENTLDFCGDRINGGEKYLLKLVSAIPHLRYPTLPLSFPLRSSPLFASSTLHSRTPFNYCLRPLPYPLGPWPHQNALPSTPPLHPPSIPLHHAIHRLNRLSARNLFLATLELLHLPHACSPSLLHYFSPFMQNFSSSAHISFELEVECELELELELELGPSMASDDKSSVSRGTYCSRALDVSCANSASWVFSRFSPVLCW